MSRQSLSATESHSQTRRVWLWVAASSACLTLLGVASCRSRALAERAPAAVPEHGAAKWNRTAVEAIPSSDLLAGSVSGARLTYTGPLPIEVDLYQMASSGSAFEAAGEMAHDGG
jgi:hypothetical protein